MNDLDEPMCSKCDLRETRRLRREQEHRAQRELGMVHGLGVAAHRFFPANDPDRDRKMLYAFMRIFHPEVSPDAVRKMQMRAKRP